MTEWFSTFAGSSLLGTQAVLPPVSVLPTGVALSWGVCVTALCWLAARRWHGPFLRFVAAAVLLSVCLPWTRGWTAYLALAFQTPSWVTCLWCAVCVIWGGAQEPKQSPAKNQVQVGQVRVGAVPWLSLAGVLLGWGLWVDTFNRWAVLGGIDVPLYDWGFGAPALITVTLLTWVYAAWTWWHTSALTRGQQVVAVALLGFAMTRWSTGNVWDALLDPWVWAACHIQCFKAAWGAWRTSKYSRQNSKFSGV
jgi:hypothetical protein